MIIYIPFRRESLDNGKEITLGGLFFRKMYDTKGLREAIVNIQQPIVEQYFEDIFILSWIKDGMKHVQCFKTVDIRAEDLDFMDCPEYLSPAEGMYG